MTLDELFSLDNLNEAFYECIKDGHWKESTHKYWANLLQNNLQLRKEILDGTYRVSQLVRFTIHERGKIRRIEAPAMRDRIVQKVICMKVLIPQITPYLIYDNYASLKHRGTSLARKRLEIDLREYIAEYGDDGCVLLIDIHDYFGSINVKRVEEQIHEHVKESAEVLNFIDYCIEASSHGDNGLNLGAEIPQICAVFYLYRLDDWIKIVQGEKAYGRYMDDIRCIVRDKDRAATLLREAVKIIHSEGLEINEKKTQIVKLSHGFTYLQTKYNVDGNRLITRPTHDKITRERRRLKKQRKLVDEGRASEKDVFLWYMSWRNELLADYNSCWKTIQSMEKEFYALFKPAPGHEKKSREELIEKAFREAEYEDLQHYWRGIDGTPGLFEGPPFAG